MASWKECACLTLALLAACGSEPGVDQRSVVLITLDTFRCDALASYGGTRGVAPNLDALAAESERFMGARTVAPLTLPAHSSMFTGLFPPRHGVRGNGPAMLAPEAETLAERAARAGFQTAGFIGGLTLDRAYGAAQGFETWTQPEESESRVLGQISDRPAEQVVSDAQAWLAHRDRARPFFLWVHLFDAHAPYAAPPAFVERAQGHPYFGEVARLDAAVGELLASLRADGTLEQLLVCVVGDHGEALGEHGEDTHGQHLWDSTLRVPFFVRHRGGQRAGTVRGGIASVVDVAPTLLDAMGLELPRDIDGLSLLDSGPPAERGAYFETLSGWARFHWSPMCGWIDARTKYVHSSTPRLNALGPDGVEGAQLSDAARVDAARAAIRRVLSAPRLETRTAASGPRRAVAELGYGDAGDFEPEYPDPLETQGLPSPDERIDEYRVFVAAQTLNQTGRHAEAVSKLEPLIAGNPDNLHALDELALALVELHEWTRAIAVLKERALRPPDRLSTHQRFVQCYTALGDAPNARLHALRALELLIESHARRGEREQAERYRAIYEAERAKG